MQHRVDGISNVANRTTAEKVAVPDGEAQRVTMIDATFGNVDYHLRRFTALNQKSAA